MGRGWGKCALTAKAIEMMAPLFSCQMWCDQLGGIWQVLLTFYVFLFSHFTLAFFFHFWSSFLSCFFLPSCLCVAAKGRLVLSMGREGYLLPSTPTLALWVPWHGGLFEARDKHPPTVGGSHHTALHPLCHKACWDPTWCTAGVLRGWLLWRWGELKKNAYLTMTLRVREGRKFFFLEVLTSFGFNSLYTG